MRAAARRIIDDLDADPDKVNALEQPHSADVIPDRWTPEHVGKRIVEAFETLAKLPPIRGPRVPGNSWPQYVYEWQDRLAQEEISEREKVRRRREQNAPIVRPSSEDLRRMDIVLGWMSDLARVDEALCILIQRWARLRSIPGRSVKGECRRKGISHQAFYRIRDRGIALIVERIGATPIW